MSFEVISVIGLGYIGLPTAAILASRRKRVVGVDVDSRTTAIINQGSVHIVEPDLDMLVHAAVNQGYLRAVTAPEPAEAFLIAVPTPISSDHQPDVSYIESASRSIAPVLKKNDLVILESTSPVGATEQMAAWLAELRPDLSFPQQAGEDSDVRIAHCPERVLPGQVLHELVHNDRIVGGMTSKCSKRAVELYKLFVKGQCIVTDVRTAEMCKLAENSFRDVNIAFANELSIICDKHGIDVWELIKLANRHPRVNILSPGPGVGGHCIAIDPWFIVSQSPEEARLIRVAREVNDYKPYWVTAKLDVLVRQLCVEQGKSIHEITIACFGLSFKADIDDLRESPACKVVLEVLRYHAGSVLAVEPHIDALPDELQIAGLRLVDIDTAVKADILVFLVDHQVFKDNKITVSERQRMLDTRGMWRN
ncbi:UDP-N-acetyl-D-mannosamine dehydrogenase [Ectopseudomonas mendocina]|uniref:UDP-N-acetyl-D-mannosamine dehydrogenase n=1 Tax=Ectopseudomonas mendocina TaxID=300 RepID=UPI001ADF208E|nr:UDP-N-acetyl-D-mannosamine dehydrogenase [Pseudomonas mendocina]QTN45223.1 UDP-N-acetyl-D-mannosamine dehydrogenase [Pseudomonas mendocina]